MLDRPAVSSSPYVIRDRTGRVIARPRDVAALLDLLASYARDGWDAYTVTAEHNTR